MVNNFNTIKEHLIFPNERSFYFVQILKRKKENPEMKTYSLPVESFYIFSNEQFERVMPHIIEKCEQNRARAYIKMNTLDANSVGLEAISVLTQELRQGNWKSLSKAFNSACGICGKQDGTEKLYLVDIDEQDYSKVVEVEEYINSLNPVDNRYKIKMVVPTKNGWHLLSTGFDMQSFKNTYNNIDVHKDGIVLLYYPDVCCENE
jgi:hypothetical protein